VFNPARIWKLYGTWARKGDDTKSRPHRLSRIFPDAPEKFEDVPVTPFAVLEKLAGMEGENNAENGKDIKS
jgi:hypothetical protein